MSIDIAAVFDPLLSDVSFPLAAISKERAESLYTYFKQHPLLNWEAPNNGCEARADAVCILLDENHIPNYKAWVFSGFFLKKNAGQLKNYWNYHVAPLIPVEENGVIFHYVLDPATAGSLLQIDEWAIGITQFPETYYSIRQSHWYIFPAKQLRSRKWHSRNKRNRKWMIECLAGINTLTKTGRAKLIFNKGQIKKMATAFEQARKDLVLKPEIVII